MTTSFPIPEDQLIISLGVPRSALRKMRATMTRGVDWDLDGGKIGWTEAAAANAARLLTSVEAPTTPAEKNAPEILLVAATNLPNPILLACVRPGVPLWKRSEWCMVRIVATARGMFVPGMELTALRLIGENAFRFLGPPGCTEKCPIRYPKRRGQW